MNRIASNRRPVQDRRIARRRKESPSIVSTRMGNWRSKPEDSSKRSTRRSAMLRDNMSITLQSHVEANPIHHDEDQGEEDSDGSSSSSRGQTRPEEGVLNANAVMNVREIARTTPAATGETAINGVPAVVLGVLLESQRATAAAELEYILERQDAGSYHSSLDEDREGINRDQQFTDSFSMSSSLVHGHEIERARPRRRRQHPRDHIAEEHLQRNRKRIKQAFMIHPNASDETMEFRQLIEQEEEYALKIARAADLASDRAQRASERSLVEGFETIANDIRPKDCILLARRQL